MIATLVYEPRRDDTPVQPRNLPKGRFLEALTTTTKLHHTLSDLEADHDLPPTRDLSAQLAMAVYRWAKGNRLEDVLEGDDIQAGDFVRWCKQIIDALDQIISVGEGPVPRTAELARSAVFRGIVALSSVA